MAETKEVYYDVYCKICEHEDTDDSENPCNDCLAHPCNWDSHKPMFWEENESAKSKKASD